MMRYVVTGGAGFIGSNIVAELVRLGNEVTVIDNLLTGNILNIQEVMGEINFIKGDINDLVLLKKAFNGADYVLHEAAVPSVPRSIKDPLTSNNANITGTLKVLIAAKECGIKRIVYASSSSVYGDVEVLPKQENMAPNPISPYALTKYAGELYCRLFYETYGLDTVSLRYFNVFGPKQDPTSQYSAVIPLFINAVLNGKVPIIHGDGNQTRDFCYISNVISANLLACTAKNVSGKVFNIACGERISINNLLGLINKVVGGKIQPKYIELRKGDIKHSLADISHAKSLLNYHILDTVYSGVKKTIEYYKNARY